ncbi:MAG: HD domain-containing protein [Candidatus Micrarchaeota archaeon]
MKIIRDAIHSNIELNELELAILDTPQMQRLRHIRQLALTYLVYPSASHTRFEHSLGTFHLTKLLSDRLFEDKRERELLCLAAMLHDVGHPAFSHLPEELIREHTGKTHEQLGEEKIISGNIADVLVKNSISPKELLKIYKSEKAEIITSELGTDRMDYLLRDAYFTGVGYSLIDAERLLFSLAFKEGKLMIQEKGVLAAESLLVSRYLMFNAVYNHHAVRIAKEMLEKALRVAVSHEKIKIEEISDGADDVVLNTLRAEPLVNSILTRNLYKAAYEKADFAIGKNENKAKKEIEGALLAELNYADFVICLPKQPMGGIKMKLLKESGGTVDFSFVSSISKAVSMQPKASGLIVAASKQSLEKARKICKKTL